MAEVFKIEVETNQLESLLSKIKDNKNNKNETIKNLNFNNGGIISQDEIKKIQETTKLKKEDLRTTSTLNLEIIKNINWTKLLTESISKFFKAISSSLKLLLTGGGVLGFGLNTISKSIGDIREGRLLNISGAQKIGLENTEKVYDTEGNLKAILNSINQNLFSNQAYGEFAKIGINREELTRMNGIERLKSVLNSIQKVNEKYKDDSPLKNFMAEAINNLTGGKFNYIQSLTNNRGANGEVSYGILEKIEATLTKQSKLYNSGDIKNMEGAAYKFNEALVGIETSFKNLAIASSPALISIINSLSSLFKEATPTISKTINEVREFFKMPFSGMFNKVKNFIGETLKEIINWVKSFFGDLFKGIFTFNLGGSMQKPLKSEEKEKKVKIDIHLHDKGNNIKNITSSQTGQLNYSITQGVK